MFSYVLKNLMKYNQMEFKIYRIAYILRTNYHSL